MGARLTRARHRARVHLCPVKASFTHTFGCLVLMGVAVWGTLYTESIHRRSFVEA